MTTETQTDSEGRLIALDAEEAAIYAQLGYDYVLAPAEPPKAADTAKVETTPTETLFEISPTHAAAQSAFAKLDAARDADLAPLWAEMQGAYADLGRIPMVPHASHHFRRAQNDLVDACVPRAEVLAYVARMDDAKRRRQPLPEPSFPVEDHARQERARLRRADPDARTADGLAAMQSSAFSEATRVVDKTTEPAN